LPGSKTRLTRADDRQGMQNLQTAPSDAPTDAPHLIPGPGARPGPVVDIVIPVFDEERVLGPSVRRLHTF